MSSDANVQSYAELLKLKPIGEVYAPPKEERREDWFANQRAGRRLRALLLVCIVVLPTIATCTYFWFIAADRYVSEARFVIRTPGRNMPNMVTGILQSTGIGRSGDDAFVVREFILSRDAVTFLDRNGRMREAMVNPHADFLWRFPNFFTPNNEEGLYRQYQRIMTSTYDQTSGVSTLRVQAFRPKDAQHLAAELLSAAEQLVNRLNVRAHRDSIVVAEQEVARSEARVVEAQAHLTTFRIRESLVDPTQVTVAVLESIARLSIDAAQINMQLTELRRISPQSPQLAPLQTRQAAIEGQISIERHKLAGDDHSIATKIAEYERLVLEREFSERVLTTTLGALEVARIEAQRQQIYLERVAEPGLPDHPSYPYRILWCLVVFVVSYMAFRIIDILVADARRHTSQ